MDRSGKTLVEPGHEAEWDRLGAEKRSLLTPPPSTPIGELLRRGQHLSAQANGLIRAIEGPVTVPDPQLDRVVVAMSKAGAKFVVIGGFTATT